MAHKVNLYSHGDMRALTIADSADVAFGVQEQIRRSEESRYDHRLHGVLLMAQGVTCPQVAHLLGDSRRTVEYWVHRFEGHGLAGLREGERPGRPSRLSGPRLKLVSAALRLPPQQFGLEGHLWDGKLLPAHVEQEFGVRLGVRQCQRLFRQFGFPKRKGHEAERALVDLGAPALIDAIAETISRIVSPRQW
jgi:transposase